MGKLALKIYKALYGLDIEAQSNELVRLRLENKRLSELLRSTSREYNSLNEKYKKNKESINSEYGVVSDELQKLKEKYETIVMEKEALEKSANEDSEKFKEEMNRISLKSEKMTGEIASLQKVIEGLNAEKETLEKEKETLGLEKEKLARELETLCSDKSSISKELETLKEQHLAEKEGLNNEYGLVADELKSLKEKYESIVKEKESLESSAKENSEKLKEETTKISLESEKMTGEIENLQKVIEGLNTEINGLNAEIADLNTQVETLSKDKEALSKENEALKKEKDVIGKEKEALDKEVEILNNEKNTLNNDKVALNKELETLRKKLESLKENHQTEKDNIGKELKSVNELHATEKDSLKKEIESLNKEVEGLNKELSSVKEQYLKEKEGNSVLSERVKALENEIESISLNAEEKTTEEVPTIIEEETPATETAVDEKASESNDDEETIKENMQKEIISLTQKYDYIRVTTTVGNQYIYLSKHFQLRTGLFDWGIEGKEIITDETLYLENSTVAKMEGLDSPYDGEEIICNFDDEDSASAVADSLLMAICTYQPIQVNYHDKNGRTTQKNLYHITFKPLANKFSLPYKNLFRDMLDDKIDAEQLSALCPHNPEPRNFVIQQIQTLRRFNAFFTTKEGIETLKEGIKLAQDAEQTELAEVLMSKIQS